MKGSSSSTLAPSPIRFSSRAESSPARTPKTSSLPVGPCRKARQLLYLQLAFLLRAGVPLETALSQIAASTGETPLGSMARELHGEVQRGRPLADVLAERVAVFGEGAAAAVQAGYQSGKLAEVFQQLHDSLVSAEELQRSLRQATTYPAFVVSVMIAFVVFMFTWTVPRFMTLLETAAIEPPALTRTVMAISDFLTAHGLLLLGGLFLVGVALAFAFRHAGLARFRDHVLLRSPVLGPILEAAALARFGEYMALLYGSGVAIPQALELSAPTLGNRFLREQVEKAAVEIRKGQRLSALLLEGGVLPHLLAPVVAAGESGGQLYEAFRSLADWYQRRLPFLTRSLTALIEPILILVLVGVTALIAVSVILPMISLWKLSG